MKLIASLFVGALATALGALLAMMFQAPITRYFSPDRLVAEVSIAPWRPLPVSSVDTKKISAYGDINPYRMEDLLSGRTTSFVRIKVANHGAKDVHDIKFNMGEFPPMLITVYRDGKLSKRFIDHQVVPIAPLKPGDTTEIFAWSVHDVADQIAFNHWKTFSSEGPITLHIRQYGTKSRNDDGVEILGSLLGWIFDIAIILLFCLLLWSIVYMSRYIDELIKDEDWYLQERSRHDANPKRFSPKLRSKATAAS